ncbi:MAG: alpha/beta hydrolase [Alphaproteobacteria bacterium]|nr:alpha/beta hydrolase [Alphaproteobacteria bacterium]
MKLYRDFDQTGLDAQYNIRARVPSFEADIARWGDKSLRAAKSLAATLDVAYGPGAAEKLDIFPAGAAAPVLVFIHGGYWRAMDKEIHRFPALGLVPAGIACVTINYALAPSVRMDEIVREVRSALAWVWRNARMFGADPDRIHVCGHSAGGHLTAMTLATDWPGFAADLPPRLVKGGMPISGIYDLEPIRLCYLNSDVRLDQAEARRNSPMFLAPRGPSWMTAALGGLEAQEFHRQQAELAAGWRSHGLDVAEITNPRDHHFDIVDRLSEPDDPLTRALVARIKAAR